MVRCETSACDGVTLSRCSALVMHGYVWVFMWAAPRATRDFVCDVCSTALSVTPEEGAGGGG